MAIVDWPQDMTTVIDRLGPHHRVGGYYATMQEIEEAANLLEFDVIVPPKSSHGYYMIPTPGGEDVREPADPNQQRS